LTVVDFIRESIRKPYQKTHSTEGHQIIEINYFYNIFLPRWGYPDCVGTLFDSRSKKAGFKTAFYKFID